MRVAGARSFILAGLAATFALLVVLFAPASADEADKGVLANLISNALSSSTRSVSIGAVEGMLSSNATIRNLVIADRDGPWLKVDEATLVWSRLALLSRRLDVDKLTIKHMQVLRRPVANETPPAETGGPQAILPELPLKVIVRDFAVQELALGEPVLGVAARLTIAGKATLGPPSEGLDVALTSRRLDAPGAFKALMTYVPATDRLTVSVNSEEPAGGLFVHLANIPGLPPATFSSRAQDLSTHSTQKLDFSAGEDAFARGDVTVARQGSARLLTLDLEGKLEGLTPEIVRPVVAGETTLKGDILFAYLRTMGVDKISPAPNTIIAAPPNRYSVSRPSVSTPFLCSSSIDIGFSLLRHAEIFGDQFLNHPDGFPDRSLHRVAQPQLSFLRSQIRRLATDEQNSSARATHLANVRQHVHWIHAVRFKRCRRATGEFRLDQINAARLPAARTCIDQNHQFIRIEQRVRQIDAGNSEILDHHFRRQRSPCEPPRHFRPEAIVAQKNIADARDQNHAASISPALKESMPRLP